MKEIIEAISQINHEIYESSQIDDWTYVTLVSDGDECVVEFMGNHIWCSADDSREYDAITDDYEPLEPFLRTLCKNELRRLLPFLE